MSASKHYVKHIALTVICAAVLAACGGGGGGGKSIDTNLVNAQAARSVMNQIEALDAAADLEADDTEAVAKATQAYNALSDAQKALVSAANRTKLEEAIKAIAVNSAAAAEVTQVVNNLPTNPKLNSSNDDLVAAARSNYDALTAQDKTWVAEDTLNKLVQAEATVAANKAAASAWVDSVEALPAALSLVKDNEAEVDAVQTAYNNLTTAQKSYLAGEDLAKLTARQSEIEKNRQLAADFAKQVEALPQGGMGADDELNSSNDGLVVTARGNYDALTAQDKTWVAEDILNKLVQAEETVAANKAAASAWVDSVEALPAALSLVKDNEAEVDAVQTAYNNLTTAQKSYLAGEDLAKLTARQSEIEKNRQLAADFAKQVDALPQGGIEVDIDEEEKALVAANAAYAALSDNQKTWVSSATESKLAAVSSKVIMDNNSLAALNLPTPLHTSFISSNTAQQHNPHVQLRVVDGQSALVDTQIGLIRSLMLSPNAPVVVDGAVLSSDNEVGYLTPYSATTKASSAGTTQENINELVGEKTGVYSNVKTSLDAEILETFTSLEEARKVSEDPDSDLKQIEEAKAEIAKLEPIYERDMERRKQMEDQVNTVVSNLAYIKKDKNGLMFDKAFDGVYIIQFENGTQVVMHDPAAAGWTYQTFAHYVDPVNGILHGYQSLGDETTVAQMPTSGTATYKGITTAYLDSKAATRQVTADVEAVADFAKKGVRFVTSGSQIHTLSDNVRTSVAAANLDMKGKAFWSAGENAFKGNVITDDKAMTGTFNGKFYGGASVAEIGGTYGLKNQDNTEQLIGGYGAKRQ